MIPGPDARSADEIVRIGRLLYDRRYVVATEGNLSVRIAAGRFLITPAGVSKGELDASRLVELDLHAAAADGQAPPPSSEWRMHAEIYRLRTDVAAVCHGHPACATAFACARTELPVSLLPEALLILGDDVPLLPYITPGTDELAASLRGRIEDRDVLLLANHGVVTVGSSLAEAYQRLETVERLAEVALGAKRLGGGVRLTRRQRELVREARRR
ncbi:class II aldolase/adducin family protein [bacterium]|nr:class II aldolase/adducin family protein [bacterium]MBU1074404.1 class II aldolase/adducin family protein [bacterium]MBU1676292.1 class II aldolase/adducin family protein [bacterium]